MVENWEVDGRWSFRASLNFADSVRYIPARTQKLLAGKWGGPPIYISVRLMQFLYLSWQFGGSTVPALVRAALHIMTLGVDNISWRSFGVFHVVFNVPTSHDAFLF